METTVLERLETMRIADRLLHQFPKPVFPPRQVAIKRKARTRWATKNKAKRHVHYIAARAQRKGLLVNPGVCKCGATGRIEKHHPDYSKPLVVEWLCPKCHGLTKRKPLTP